MPKGPKGERRPGDVIGAAVMVGKIATGEIEEPTGKAPNRAKGGLKGGKARATKPMRFQTETLPNIRRCLRPFRAASPIAD